MVQSIVGVLRDTGSTSVLPVQPISWVRGEDGAIGLTVTDEARAVVNLTGRVVEAGFRGTDSSAVPLFVRLAVLTAPLTGECTFYLSAADTAGLAPGVYRFDVWVTDEDGRHQVVAASNFRVTEADTLPGEGGGSASPIAPVVNGNVADLDDLALVDASRLGWGFLIYVTAEDDYFQVRIDSGLSADADHVAALGLTNGWWARAELGSAASGTVESVTAPEGDMLTVDPADPANPVVSIGTPAEVTAALVPATTSDQGAQSPTDKAKVDAIWFVKSGTALTDADQTLQPGTDKASNYDQALALTGDRTKILGTTSVETSLVVFISRLESSPSALTIANGGPNNAEALYVFTGSQVNGKAAAFQFDGVDWQLIGIYHLSQS
jgi:hypothetical protein